MTPSALSKSLFVVVGLFAALPAFAKTNYDLSNPACNLLHNQAKADFMASWNTIYAEADKLTRANVTALQKFASKLSKQQLESIRSFAGRPSARKAVLDHLLRDSVWWAKNGFDNMKCAFLARKVHNPLFHSAFVSGDEAEDQDYCQDFVENDMWPPTFGLYAPYSARNIFSYSDGNDFGLIACGMKRIDSPNLFADSDEYLTTYGMGNVRHGSVTYVPAVSCTTLRLSRGKPEILNGSPYEGMTAPQVRKYLHAHMPDLGHSEYYHDHGERQPRDYYELKKVSSKLRYLDGVDRYLEQQMPANCVLAEKPQAEAAIKDTSNSTSSRSTQTDAGSIQEDDASGVPAR